MPLFGILIFPFQKGETWTKNPKKTLSPKKRTFGVWEWEWKIKKENRKKNKNKTYDTWKVLIPAQWRKLDLNQPLRYAKALYYQIYYFPLSGLSEQR